MDKIKANLDPINEQKLNLKDKIDLKITFKILHNNSLLLSSHKFDKQGRLLFFMNKGRTIVTKVSGGWEFSTRMNFDFSRAEIAKLM